MNKISMAICISSDTMDEDPDLCCGKKDGVAEKVPWVFQIMCCAFGFLYKLGELGESICWTLHLTSAGGKPFCFCLVLAVFPPRHVELLSPRIGLGKCSLELWNPRLGAEQLFPSVSRVSKTHLEFLKEFLLSQACTVCWGRSFSCGIIITNFPWIHHYHCLFLYR